MNDNEFKSFFKSVGGNEGSKCNYPTRMDSYGRGCSNNCSYCYAKSLLAFRNLWDPDNPAIADIEKIKRKLRKVERGTILRLGGMTDCFQACEEKYGVTYEAIKMMNELGIGYLIVTKCSLVAEDRYISIMDPGLAHIQISVTTTDDHFNRTYENTDSFSQRVQAIEKLQQAGFDVTLRLSPFIPQFIDFEVLNAVRCDKILIEFLRVNSWIKKWFDLDYKDYTLKQSGYCHLPLDKKLEYIKQINGFEQMSVCEDVTEHYDYWKKYFNSNPEDCCNLNKVTVSNV